MATPTKRTTYLTILSLTLLALTLSLFRRTSPSKARLCQDLESYIPQNECTDIDSRVAILKRAFPEGKTSSNDVKNALGAYLNVEYPTTYGHLEEYYLSVRPIDHLFRNYDSYRFGYDSNGTLVAFSYED
jgi:hypothetical protein